MRLKSKRLISLLLAGSMMVSMLPASAVTAFAETTNHVAVVAEDDTTVPMEGECGEQLHWALTKNEDGSDTYTLTITGSGAMTNYAAWNKTPWATACQNENQKITQIVLSEGITSICPHAFRYAGIKSINIPASVTNIGTAALAACEDNTEITVSEGNENFYATDGILYEHTDAGDVLRFCPAAKTGTITIPEGVVAIGSESMEYSQFSGVEIPASVTSIESYALARAKVMTEITIPATVTSLGVGVLQRSGSLKKVTLLATVTEIPKNFVFEDSQITSFEIPNNITVIGQNAFSKTGLTSIETKESSNLEKIGISAFSGCHALTSVSFHGAKLQTVGKNAFYDCTSLADVDFEVNDGFDLAGKDDSGAISDPFGNTNITNISIGSANGTVKISNGLEDKTSIQNVRMFGKFDIAVNGLFRNAACTQYDLSGVTGITLSMTDALKNPFYGWRSNKTPIVYVPNTTIRNIVGGNNNDEAMIFAVTNDHTLAKNTIFENGKLATPESNDSNYVFAGWYTDASFAAETKLASGASPEKGKTYYAKWAELHTVTFADADVEPVKVANGEQLEKPTDPKKDGYKFDYWCAANGDKVTFPLTITDDTTLTAKWTPYDTKVDADVKANADPASKTVEITVNVDANLAELVDATGTLNFTDANGNDDSANVVEVKVNGITVNKNADGSYTANLNDLMNPTSDASENGVETVMLADVNEDAVVPGTKKGTALLTVTYKTPGEHKVEIVLKAANGDVICKANVPVEIAPEPGTLNLTACTATLEDGTPVENGAKVPVGAKVTVTYEQDADSDLVLNGWKVTPENLTDTDGKPVKDITADTFTFVMPETDEGVTIEAMTKAKAAAPAEDDSLDAATVVTGVVLGTGTAILAYHIGTQVYAEQVLGKGVAIPRTREEVALKAWELAGKPAVELNGEPLSEAAQAEKWAVESGLMQNVDGSFNGSKKMSKLKALRTLDAAKKLG